MTTESQIEQAFIAKLTDLKYDYRPEIRDREALERNFREKFEALNRVKLLDSEFARLLDQIVDPDVFASASRLREYNTFMREDGAFPRLRELLGLLKARRRRSGRHRVLEDRQHPQPWQLLAL